MDTLAALRTVLAATLNLGERGQQLEADSPLLGSLPELDSMAVISVVAALEDRFDIVIDDEDISARNFATLGSLAALIDSKIPA